MLNLLQVISGVVHLAGWYFVELQISVDLIVKNPKRYSTNLYVGVFKLSPLLHTSVAIPGLNLTRLKIVIIWNMFQSLLAYLKEHRRLVQSTPSRLIGKTFQVEDTKYARSPNSNSDEMTLISDEMPEFLIFVLLCKYSSLTNGLQVRTAPVDDDRGWAVWLASLPPTGGGLCNGSWRLKSYMW